MSVIKVRLLDLLRNNLNLGKLLNKDNKNYEAYLGGFLVAKGSFFISLSFLLTLGKFFNNIHLLLNLTPGFFALLYGAYCFWYANTKSKELIKESVSPWKHSQVRFAVKAGIISVVTATIFFLIVLLKVSCPYWHFAILFFLGLGLYCFGLYWLGFFEVFRKELESIDQDTQSEKSQPMEPTYLGQTLGYFVYGSLYVSIFLPLTIRSALANGLKPIDVLLFARLTEIGIKLSSFELLDTLLSFSNPSHLLAFGVLFGVGGIIVGLMRLALRRDGWLEIAIMSNGIIIGYIATIWFKHILGSPLSYKLLSPLGLSLAYVFLLYYGLRALLDLVARWGFRAKYEHLVRGIQSIGTAWILSRVFGDQSIILSGVTFYISTFLATSLIESTVGRLIKKLYKVISEVQPKSAISTTINMAKGGNSDFYKSFYITTSVSVVFPFLALGFGILISVGFQG